MFGNDMKNHLDKCIDNLVATREIYVNRYLYDANIMFQNVICMGLVTRPKMRIAL